MFDFLLADKETFQIESLILLLFKIYLYESLISKAMIFDSFLRKIKKAYVMEKNCSINNETKQKHLNKKWLKMAHLI